MIPTTSGRRVASQVLVAGRHCYKCESVSYSLTSVPMKLPNRTVGMTLNQDTAFVGLCPTCYRESPHYEKDRQKRIQLSRKKATNRARSKAARKARR